MKKKINIFLRLNKQKEVLREENENLQVGDVLLMKGTKDKLDHVALYVGDQTILQHCVKRLSSRETYDEKWIECTKKRYRYAQ